MVENGRRLRMIREERCDNGAWMLGNERRVECRSRQGLGDLS